MDHGVLIVPRSGTFTPDAKMEVDLYVIRRFTSDEAEVQLDQEGFDVQHKENGYYTLSMLARQPSQQKLSGSIRLLNEAQRLPFASEHWVIPPPPSATSRVLVKGRKNRIDVGIPGIPESEVGVSVTNATVVRGDGAFYVTPHGLDTVKVILTYETEMGTKQMLPPISFEVVDAR